MTMKEPGWRVRSRKSASALIAALSPNVSLAKQEWSVILSQTASTLIVMTYILTVETMAFVVAMFALAILLSRHAVICWNTVSELLRWRGDQGSEKLVEPEHQLQEKDLELEYCQRLEEDALEQKQLDQAWAERDRLGQERIRQELFERGDLEKALCEMESFAQRLDEEGRTEAFFGRSDLEQALADYEELEDSLIAWERFEQELLERHGQIVPGLERFRQVALDPILREKERRMEQNEAQAHTVIVL